VTYFTEIVEVFDGQLLSLSTSHMFDILSQFQFIRAVFKNLFRFSCKSRAFERRGLWFVNKSFLSNHLNQLIQFTKS